MYLQRLRQSLAGRHVLMLTPEIGLIPQRWTVVASVLVRRLWSITVAAVTGSASPPGDVVCFDEPIVVVGTRSAVFLPLRPLGLLVLDEEHDNSQAGVAHTLLSRSGSGLRAGEVAGWPFAVGK